MTITSDLLQRHFQTLVEDNARWQTLIAAAATKCHGGLLFPQNAANMDQLLNCARGNHL